MQGFRASINLQFDLDNEELLERYVLTASHSEVFRGVMEGVVQEGAHAHLLIGPYGTGKSLLATLLCQYLAQTFDAKWEAELLKQVGQLDSKLAELLQQARHQDISYLPVIINGRTGSLRSIINSAIHRTLIKAGIFIETPNEAQSILDTVERWKREYKSAYKVFLAHLKQRGWIEAGWVDRIAAHEEEVLRDFITFYPTVTAGTAWASSHEFYFIENIEMIANELRRRGRGLCIVYDEFGRFLQSLGGSEAVTNMRDLQDFAEFVGRQNNIHLLVIGHKHIRQYAASERESVRGEFEKVEKRFRYYTLETDAVTFLRLAQEAIAPINRQRYEEKPAARLYAEAARFTLFAELTRYQLEHGVVRLLYPLHPVTVMLLPQLSNTFGQNERTLYSFMTDNERFSLKDHLAQSTDVYYADQLFYFFQLAVADDKEQPGLQLYHLVAPYLPEHEPLQRRIVELLTLWAVGRMTQKQAPTCSLLAFALGSTEGAVEQALQQLESAKLVRYNSIRDLWELYDGSSVDLQAVVGARMATTTLTDTECTRLVQRHLPISYVLPFEYNDEVDMLRYADVNVVTVANLKTATDVESFIADDRIWLVLYRHPDEMEDPAALMEEIDAPYLVAFPAFTAETVLPTLLQHKIVTGLLEDPAFLAQDARVKNELVYMLNETETRIKAFAERYFEFNEIEWRNGSVRRILRDLRMLEAVVTERLRHTYRRTPIIRNESFNRNRISAIQRRALVDVIDRLIQDPEAENLGITGYGPNYLIYASALKNNNYVYKSDEESISCSEKLLSIREELLRQLDESPVGSLAKLIRIMEAPPYGIRAAVTPLLFVALLRDRWNQLFFYADHMLTTHLNGASLLEIVELAEMYEYRYYRWTPEEQRGLGTLARIFELPAEAGVSFVHSSEALLRWFRRLPRYTQISNRHSPEAIVVRDHIRASETDPYVHMRQLAGEESLLAQIRLEYETFMERRACALEQRIMALTGVESRTALLETLSGLRNEAISMNSRLLSFEVTTEDEGHHWLERLAEHLVGIARTDWSDATEDLFLNQIAYEWQLLDLQRQQAAAAMESNSLANINSPTNTNSSTGRPEIELSKKAHVLYANVKNLIKYAGKDIPPQELRALLLKLHGELSDTAVRGGRP